MEYGYCQIGYPVLDKNGYTDPSTENRWMISPNFMFASRVSSSTDKVDFWAAVSRCKNYSETDTNGVTYNGWRMPTYAEMLLLDILQNVSKKRNQGDYRPAPLLDRRPRVQLRHSAS